MPQDPLSLLCIEPRFPGRLGAVADWLVRKRGYRCQFCCASAADRDCWPASVGRGLDVVAFNVGGVGMPRIGEAPQSAGPLPPRSPRVTAI